MEEGEREERKPGTDFADWSCVKTADQTLLDQLSAMIWTGGELNLCLKVVSFPDANSKDHLPAWYLICNTDVLSCSHTQ